MKLFVTHQGRTRQLAWQPQGFTFIEVMISTTLMITFILGGLLAVNMMGLREEKLLESKAGASDSARKSVTKLKNDIYGAKGWQIGTWTTNFAPDLSGVIQGNALAIYPLIITSNQIVDPTTYIVYFFDTNDLANNNGVLRLINSTNNSNQIIVSNLIYPMQFSAEDYLGNVTSNRSYKSVIHATLQYAQFQYPLTKVGSNYLFNTYRIDVRATPHLPDGP